jgi:glycosyltransferase involved in cell wall biosynthesis
LRLKGARIGYAGYSADFRHPGDRRRFSAYAEMRGLPYERARLDRDYDLALITHNSDLSGWVRRKRHEHGRLKLVFELIDSYFVHTGRARRLIKGFGRFALGTESWPSLDFLKTLIETFEAADAVICSTLEQREAIRRYNPNVFLSFDWFGDDIGAPKTDYDRGERLRIVWEGQSTTLPNLQVIREPLNDLRERTELHVVTDPLIYRHFGRFSPYPSIDALNGIECPFHFHEWCKESFSDRIVAADVAVIPIYEANPLWHGKPENKLVLFWQLGMPVLTGTTPAYQRAMTAAGLNLACATAAEWRDKLAALIESPAERLRELGTIGREYAARTYSAEEFAARFDRTFAAVGFET